MNLDPASEVIQDATKCDRCGKSPAVYQRQDTAYRIEWLNWATLCPKCQAENNKYWREKWEGAYSNLL